MSILCQWNIIIILLIIIIKINIFLIFSGTFLFLLKTSFVLSLCCCISSALTKSSVLPLCALSSKETFASSGNGKETCLSFLVSCSSITRLSYELLNLLLSSNSLSILSLILRILPSVSSFFSSSIVSTIPTSSKLSLTFS